MSSLTEGAAFEGPCFSEGCHPSFGDPRVQTCLKVDNSDAWGNAFLMEDGQAPAKPFRAVPNVYGHLPPLERVANLKVDVLGCFGRAFLPVMNVWISFCGPFVPGDVFLGV